MPNRTAGRAGPQAKEPQGITRPAQGPTQQPEPRMQYERDQSSDSQTADEPSQARMGKIAHDDLERGLVDTDKGPVIDEAYEKTRKTSTNPERKLRR
jgi:hypothetical protein